MERTDKILSNLGYCSRRQSEEFLRTHTVTVGTIHIKNGAEKVDRKQVLIDGKKLDHPDGLLIIINKPAGYVCSHDQSEGKLVYELLPDQWMNRTPVPSSIGRLDKDTTGALLITDNTTLNHAFASPKRNIDKVYEVTVDKPLCDDIITLFSSGTLTLHGEEKPCLPADLKITDATHATITIHEGRYHQVKRMFQACGFTVVALHRSRFGEYTLEDVETGQYRELQIPNLKKHIP
jgi:16S rRNA pseudouridine516 synthase